MKRYNMPHRSRVVKTRLTDEEYADFTARLAPYGMSQSEFIRQAITRATIRPIVTVSPVNDELLAAVGKLTAWLGAVRENLWFGKLLIGGFTLHPLVLLFALSGSLMISRIRIPKL